MYMFVVHVFAVWCKIVNFKCY